MALFVDSGSAYVEDFVAGKLVLEVTVSPVAVSWLTEA